MEAATGCYFRREDYATFWRRLLTDIIDGLIVAAICLLLAAVLWAFGQPRLFLWCWAAVFFCYFVLLKRSTFGTLGFRLAGVRIVGLDGQRPSVCSLSLRLMFMVLGPLNYLLDLFWLPSDQHRQALRDKFAQSYVVKRTAAPAGTAKVVHRYYEILGYNFLFREMEVEERETAAP